MVSDLISNADSSSLSYKFVSFVEIVFRVLYSSSHALYTPNTLISLANIFKKITKIEAAMQKKP